MAANSSDVSQPDLTPHRHQRSQPTTDVQEGRAGTKGSSHSLRRRLLSDGSWAFGAKIVTTLATLVTNVLLARLLTPAEFGTYILALSIVSFGAAAGTLGLNQVVVRFVAESLAKRDAPRARRVIVISLRLGVLGTLGLSAAYLLLNPYLNQHLFSSPLLVSLAGLIAAWAALTVLQRLIGESFRGLHDIRYASIFRGWKEGMLSSVLTVAGLAVLWFYAGRTGLATVLWITVAAGVSSSLLGILLLNSKLRGLKATDTGETPSGDLTSRDLLHVAWPLLINNLTLFLLTQSDIWILAALRPQEDIAVYGTAARLAGLVTIPLFVINAVVPPLIADLYIRREQQKLQQILRTITTTAGLPALVALVLLAFFGGPVLGLLFGDFFRQGATLLAILCLGQFANVYSGPCGLVLVLTGHERVATGITIFTTVLTVSLGLWATRQFGALGLASVFSASALLENILKLFFARRLTGVWTHANLSSLAVRNLKGLPKLSDWR